MEYLLLSIVAFTASVQNIFKKKYSAKKKGGVFLFSAMCSAVACLFFIAINRDWSYSVELLVPSLGFAAAYSTAIIFSFLAIRDGSLAKSNLIISCSLLIPAFYGMLFLNEPPRPTLLVGLVILVAALVLTNYEKEEKNGTEKKTTLKWFIFVILAFIGNGMCSTVQKIEAIHYGDRGKNTFMIVALAIVAVVLTLAAVIAKDERKTIQDTVRAGWLLALLCGTANGLTNFLVLLLNSILPASVMFPVISAVGLIIAFLYSSLVEKEKFTSWQKLGYLLGVISIVLMNL